MHVVVAKVGQFLKQLLSFSVSCLFKIENNNSGSCEGRRVIVCPRACVCVKTFWQARERSSVSFIVHTHIHTPQAINL